MRPHRIAGPPAEPQAAQCSDASLADVPVAPEPPGPPPEEAELDPAVQPATASATAAAIVSAAVPPPFRTIHFRIIRNRGPAAGPEPESESGIRRRHRRRELHRLFDQRLHDLRLGHGRDDLAPHEDLALAVPRSDAEV